MVLLEIHQRFKGHFLSKLRVSFKRQPHKMVKHIQIIRRQKPACLSVLDHFVGLALKGLRIFLLRIVESALNFC